MSTSLKEVFGISSNLLKSYVLRHHVDDDFKDKIELTDHHIVVFGETKVGKSRNILPQIKRPLRLIAPKELIYMRFIIKFYINVELKLLKL
ncbi:hypothetical protein RY280_09760 [Bacillus paralicheniformis]|uniref:hypothetical protein n=1 Tax=Bacillus paralicheniformis TaxID=1648923 RepID=UPI003A8831A6